MDSQEKRIAKRNKRSDEIAYRTDGTNHQISAKGDTAKGLAAAASAIFGFAIGFFLVSRN